MKKLIFAFAATAITLCVNAQADSLINSLPPDSFIKTIPPDFDNTPKNTNSNTEDKMQNSPVKNAPGEKIKSHPDGVIMLNGKMMLIFGGTMKFLKKGIIMSNSTKVKRDGTIVKKNGTEMWMKEGDHVDLSGRITTMKDSGSTSK
ncbi:MAG: DUF6799 domain-containing protein [Chitinophagales bacterium]|nr:DUF6799 domain-containing protein [Chitinophagales bacterium]